MKKRSNARRLAGPRARDNYHLRELPSHVFDEHKLTPEFRQFVHEEVLPRIILKGYKRDRQRELVTHAVHNLVTTGLVGACVSDTRDTHTPGVKLRVKVWDAVIAAGLARHCLGSEAAVQVTRYRATDKLLALREQWELRLLLDLHLARNTEMREPSPQALIYLHSGKVDPATGRILPEDQQKQPVSLADYIARHAQLGPDGKPDPRAIKNGLDYFRKVEDIIERINRSNLEHSWQAFTTDHETGNKYVFQPNPCLRQIHVGELFRAVRLYSWSVLSGQNLAKGVRQSMLIDGEPVAEFDFSGLATRMLYHLAGLDPKGDVYQPEKVLPKFHALANASKAKKAIARDFVKQATNIFWNVSTRAKAHSSVGKLLVEHEQSEFLGKVLSTVEGIDPTDVVARIMKAHPGLRDQFFTATGLELMTLDGKIMLHILMAFAAAGKPALGIHDAIVCKESDAEFTRQTMAEVYAKFMGFEPAISRVF